jgi:hypothetical protein
MRTRTLGAVLLFSLSVFVSSARAQYVSVAAGGLFPQNLSSNSTIGTLATVASASFDRVSIITVDAGTGFLPFIGINAHYSYSSPDMDLRRGDVFGSRATLGLRAHTLALEARVHPPIPFIHPYGFVGGGFTRFGVDVKQQIEIPFPNGVPDNVTAPLVTFGGGVNFKFLPLIGGKIEVRDYMTPITSKFYSPGGSWHRVAVVAGIVLGR